MDNKKLPIDTTPTTLNHLFWSQKIVFGIKEARQVFSSHLLNSWMHFTEKISISTECQSQTLKLLPPSIFIL